MSNELVKRLVQARANVGLPMTSTMILTDEQTISDAIALISAQDDVRDSVLEEAAAWHSHTAQEMERVVNGLISAEAKVIQLAHVSAHDQSAAYFRALKSAPNTKEAPKMYERYKGKDGACLSADTRVMADRRKSAGGIANEPNRQYRLGYGRRPGDRARWTGEAAPVVRKAGPCIICGLCHEHDETHGYYATQPAQEAPQPEKPGHTYSAAFKTTFVDRKAFGHPDIPTNCERPMWSHYYWLLRELDARQGEK